MNENLQDQEVPEENQEDNQEVSEDVSESNQAITLEDFQTYNLNMCTGFLFVTGCLGIIAGAIVCSALKGILKK